ncbi:MULTISPECIES: hypothetical protein [unclassified Rhizobium]|nr:MULTISPECIES: hypothetical protein [unclassified Rhizobium]MCV3765537.1 hypothetical protein [Rhizobium sp. TRM95796]
MDERLESNEKGASAGKRLLWFFGLWIAGVAAVSLVGLAIRTVLI